MIGSRFAHYEITSHLGSVVGNGTDVNPGINFDVSRDGRFLINTLLDDVGASPITLLQNWKHQ